MEKKTRSAGCTLHEVINLETHYGNFKEIHKINYSISNPAPDLKRFNELAPLIDKLVNTFILRSLP